MNNTTFYTATGLVDFSLADYPSSMNATLCKYDWEHATYWGIFVFTELDKHGLCVEPGDVFLDLGANLGMSSRYALLHGAREVLCFEPDPRLMELLKRNLAASSRFYPYFVLDTRGTSSEEYWPGGTGERYSAPAITLKDVLTFLSYPIIDYLKMDIEGAEDTIFNDLNWQDCAKIKKMLVEHHFPNKTPEMMAKLNQLGFNIEVEWGSGQNMLYCRHV